MPCWNGLVDYEVIALIEPRKLAHTWEAGAHATVVTWRLEPAQTGTLVRFAHAGFTGMGDIATACGSG